MQAQGSAELSAYECVWGVAPDPPAPALAPVPTLVRVRGSVQAVDQYGWAVGVAFEAEVEHTLY